MKIQYFNQEQSDEDDMLLNAAKMQGYVPTTCLIGGATVMMEINNGSNPCHYCEGPRDKCQGSPKAL